MLSQEVGKYNEIVGLLGLKSPLNILALFHPDVNSGAVTLHDWQKEFNLQLAKEGTKDKPNQNLLVAANGSGKSQLIMAPWAVWICLTFQESATVITSASGIQLDKQAGRHIKMLCERVNNFFREHFSLPDVFNIQVRKIEHNYNGSIIDLFATDEAGRAEGWHALRPGAKFAIGVDEAKSVTDDIFSALDRCNDYSDILLISSPGTFSGRFFQVATMRNSTYSLRRVTAFECPHISKFKIQEQINLHGEYDPIVRSSIFAEFTSADEQVVIRRESIMDCIKYFEDNPNKHFGKKRAGLDLSAGGDEQVLSIWYGCFLVKEIAYRFTYAPMLVDAVISDLKAYGVKAEDVWADDGGMGEIYIDMFQERGWNFNRVLNQAVALDTTRYANRGTEIWFNFKRFVEEYLAQLPEDNATLIEQLANRHYRVNAKAKIILESKQEAKAKGRPSPDRADAAVLAWCSLIYPLEELSQVKKREDPKPKTDEEVLAWYDELREKKKEEKENNIVEGRYVKTNFTFSIREIMERDRKEHYDETWISN